MLLARRCPKHALTVLPWLFMYWLLMIIGCVAIVGVTHCSVGHGCMHVTVICCDELMAGSQVLLKTRFSVLVAEVVLAPQVTDR